MYKNKPWHQKCLRIAALQCNFEGSEKNTLSVLDRWIDFGFNVEQLHHFCADIHYPYYALFNEKRHSVILKRYLRKAKSKNIKIILYLNCHKLPPSAHRYKEWAQKDVSGNYRMLYDNVYYSCCLNGPWAKHFLSVIRRLKNYDIDGIFLDGPLIPAEGCYCDNCKAKYLKRWGKDIPLYPKSGGTEAEQLFQFICDTKTEFVKEVYQIFKSIKPDGICYQNLPIAHPAANCIDIHSLLPYNDLIGSEGGFQFYGPPKEAILWKPGFTAKIIESLAQGKPGIVFMAGDQKPWSLSMHSAGETAITYASIIANGGNVWYGIHGPTKMLNSPGGEMARFLIRFQKRHENWYENTRSIAQTAILYSFSTERYYRTKIEETDFIKSEERLAKGFTGDFNNAFHGFYGMLFHSQRPFDVITETSLASNKLGQYKVLFLPTSACLDENSVNYIKEFVRKGGILVADFDTSLYDGKGKRRDNFGLAEVFGVDYGGEFYSFHNYDYFSLDEKESILSGIRVGLNKAPLKGVKVKVVRAKVLARFHAPLRGRYTELTQKISPAICFNKFGKGKAIYLAGSFGEMYFEYSPPEYRKLIMAMLNKILKPQIEIEGVPPSLEVVIRRKNDTNYLLLHLVNYTNGMTRPIDKIVPIFNLRIRLRIACRVKNVFLVGSKLKIEFKQKGNSVEFIIPKISEYGVVGLEMNK